MNKNKCIYDFLESHGFKLIDENNSDYFGDYYRTFSNNNFELRILSSKSLEQINIKKCNTNERWYDLILVKTLLYGEVDYDTKSTIDGEIIFFINDFANISKLFDEKHYLNTKIRLKELGDKRVDQLFSIK